MFNNKAAINVSYPSCLFSARAQEERRAPLPDAVFEQRVWPPVSAGLPEQDVLQVSRAVPREEPGVPQVEPAGPVVQTEEQPVVLAEEQPAVRCGAQNALQPEPEPVALRGLPDALPAELLVADWAERDVHSAHCEARPRVDSREPKNVRLVRRWERPPVLCRQ